MAHIRDASPADFPALLALNAESVHFLSPMNLQRLQQLFAQAAYCRVIEQAGQVVAFLLAFRKAADYDSPNYRWFAERYPQFLYIDRVVVVAHQQGQGFGAQLYSDLFAFARTQTVSCVACEYDTEPPNAISRHFHARFGFREVGSQRVANGNKLVSLQLAASHADGTEASNP